MLFDHPSLIPVDEIEPAFDRLLPLARELPTAAGSVDLIYINSDGFLTLVETKLWRNPEARRQVVTQIIDYAKDMRRWSYRDLVSAVRESVDSARTDTDPVLSLARSGDEEFEEGRFIDRVERNLRRGRFLLLIVGDGIQEGVEEMVDFLQQTPQLTFTLGLVEMGLYRADARSNDLLFVQPRVMARTVEVTRAVVEIRTPTKPDDVVVTLPAESREGGRRRTTITEEAFYEQLAKNVDSRTLEFVRSVLAEIGAHGPQVVFRSKGPAFRFEHPESQQKFSFGYFDVNGMMGWDWLDRQCDDAGLPASIGTDYFNEVENLFSGEEGEEENYRSIAMLVPKKQQWFAAIDRAVDRIRKGLESK